MLLEYTLKHSVSCMIILQGDEKEKGLSCLFSGETFAFDLGDAAGAFIKAKRGIFEIHSMETGFNLKLLFPSLGKEGQT